MKMKIAQQLLDKFNAEFFDGRELNIRISTSGIFRQNYKVALIDEDSGDEIIDFGFYQDGPTLTIQGIKIVLEKGDIQIT